MTLSKKTNHLHLVEISTASEKFLLVGIRITTLILIQKDGRGEGEERRRRYEEGRTKVEEERLRGGGERKKKRT